MTALPNPYDRPRVRLGRPGVAELLGLFGLWAVVGILGAVSVLGMLTIGAFVLPFAMVSAGLALWLSLRGPSRWPSVTGLGVALGIAIGWMGFVQGSTSPSSGSCTVTPDGAMSCESGGMPYDPQAFGLATAAPWFAVGLIVAVASIAAFVLLRQVTLTRGGARSP